MALTYSIQLISLLKMSPARAMVRRAEPLRVPPYAY